MFSFVTTSSPCGERTVTPFARIASTWAGHCSMQVTSKPALVMSAAIAAPFAPVPTTAIRFSAIPSTLLFVGPQQRGPCSRGDSKLDLTAESIGLKREFAANAGALRSV